MEIIEKAYAKLNLTLDIVGLKNNMHQLDMIVASIDLCDIVRVALRTDNKITCVMDGKVCGAENSAVRAALLLQKRFLLSGFDINIEKHIPMSGGLGGSTADGVAVVRAICKLKNIDLKVIDNSFLLNIGSDAPCMLYNGVKRVRGIGEIVDFIDIKLPYKVGIIAGNGVDTTLAYKTFDMGDNQQNHYTKNLISNINSVDFDIANYIGNDLYNPAKKLNADIENAVQKMTSLGAVAVGMSGSGSAVFGLFDNNVPNDLIGTNFI